MENLDVNRRMIQVHKDRVVVGFPQAQTKNARIDEKYDFDPRVRQSCASERASTVGLKICKMIIIGDMAVGKTCLVNRFCKKAFDRDYKATIGVDFEVERFEILNTPFTLQMWDTAGQERFQCIASAYYRGAQVVVIVFDVSEMRSLASAQSWLEAAQKENAGSQLLTFLVGTKKDLVTDAIYRDVEHEAIKVAKGLHAEYWGVSSKTGENVKELFTRIAALSFEGAVLRELEKRQFATPPKTIGSSSFRIGSTSTQASSKQKLACCKM
uniref:Ras-related protein Rab-36 n=1 Tax=Phallusia mammillata TaxID=59560 RepID=A0A6F9DQH3_9ASCI|nr:ras-related protein Rab-34-like [Phallusia mammillata]